MKYILLIIACFAQPFLGASEDSREQKINRCLENKTYTEAIEYLNFIIITSSDEKLKITAKLILIKIENLLTSESLSSRKSNREIELRARRKRLQEKDMHNNF